jgi:hypothetical protein
MGVPYSVDLRERVRCAADRSCHWRGGPEPDAGGRTPEIRPLPADHRIAAWGWGPRALHRQVHQRPLQNTSRQSHLGISIEFRRLMTPPAFDDPSPGVSQPLFECQDPNCPSWSGWWLPALILRLTWRELLDGRHLADHPAACDPVRGSHQ